MISHYYPFYEFLFLLKNKNYISMLNMADITPKFRIVIMFDVVDLKIIFN
jgi:hypothetical protein